MKFVCCQPDSPYYHWQVKVLLTNFRKHGIEKDAILIFSNTAKEQSQQLRDLQNKTTARIVYIQDTRTDFTYIPSVRPHALKKFYYYNPQIINEDVFYHDCDIIFQSLPDFYKMNEQKVYVSDTISYIGSDYVESKSPELLERMCKIVGINKEIVKGNNSNSGGAQYLFKKGTINSDFWNKVEKDCTSLFKLMTITSKIYSPNHPIQAWCADMWAVLWNIWLTETKTEVHNELSFSWSTSVISQWTKHKIYHNAGVSSSKNNLFCKHEFINTSPFEADLSKVNPAFCSKMYVEAIKEVSDLK